MEEKELLEGKKIDDNLEVTSASEESEEEETGNSVPQLNSEPIPTKEEVENANLIGGVGDEVSGDEVKTEEPKMEEPKMEEEIKEQSEPVSEASVSVENVENVEVGSPLEETEKKVEENGVVDTPAIKTFTQSQVNEMVGNTRTETREKTFRYIYDRYGVKDEAELDELVGNAQALDSWKEQYETEKADWKKIGSERDAELESVKEQVALLQSGIDSNRFEDAKFILKGKGLEINLDNIKNELATHPEWKNSDSEKVSSDFMKVEDKQIDTREPNEPLSEISVLGNDTEGNPQGSEEEYALKHLFKTH